MTRLSSLVKAGGIVCSFLHFRLKTPTYMETGLEVGLILNRFESKRVCGD